jgi:hypothetical protein
MLTVLQEKLAEAHALAIAASTVTVEVEARIGDHALIDRLRLMRREADETRARCLAVEHGLGAEVANEVLAHANTTREKSADLAAVWLKAGTDPLAAWAFLAMGEAAEVAAWRAVRVLALGSGAATVRELADWALPVQERHLQVALDGSRRLAELYDADGPRWA